MLLLSLLLSALGILSTDQSASLPTPSGSDSIRAETLPAEFRKEIVVVPCSVAGISGLKCALDTGSSMTGMSPELVKRLKLSTFSEQGASSLSPRAYMLPPQRVQLGSNAFIVERMGMAPLAIVSKSVGTTVDLLLGTSLFEQSQITIDPGASEVRIAPPGSPISNAFHPQQIIMPLHVPVGFVQMKATTGWGILVPLTIDTGSEPALLLSKPFFDAHPGLAVSNPVMRSTDEIMSVDGMRYDVELHNLPAGQPTQGSGVLASKAVGGILGAPVLNRFKIIYDLGRSTMYVSPLPEATRPFDLALPPHQ